MLEDAQSARTLASWVRLNDDRGTKYHARQIIFLPRRRPACPNRLKINWNWCARGGNLTRAEGAVGKDRSQSILHTTDEDNGGHTMQADDSFHSLSLGCWANDYDAFKRSLDVVVKRYYHNLQLLAARRLQIDTDIDNRCVSCFNAITMHIPTIVRHRANRSINCSFVSRRPLLLPTLNELYSRRFLFLRLSYSRGAGSTTDNCSH